MGRIEGERERGWGEGGGRERVKEVMVMVLSYLNISRELRVLSPTAAGTEVRERTGKRGETVSPEARYLNADSSLSIFTSS